MKDIKREMLLFSMYDRTGLQKHFEKLAAEGWMLEDIGNCFIRYRRSEPRRIHFCVSYYYKASAFDPYPTEEEQEFRDLCAHTGWEVAASNGKLLVFYNEREDPIPIETDPALEVDAIHKAMMRSTILANAVCLLPALLGLWLSIGQLVTDPVGWLSRPYGSFSLLCWLVLLLLLGVELGGYFLWRRRALKAAEQGVFYPTPNHFPLQAVGLGVVAIALVGYLIDVLLQSSPLMKLITFVMLGWTALVYLGVNGTRILLKRKGVSRGVNRAATLAVDVALAFGLLAVIVFFTIRAAGSSLLDDSIYLSGDPPLSVSDLADVDLDGYLTRRTGDETVLLGQYEVFQHVDWRRDDPDLALPSLEYTVTEVKLPFLYSWCRDRLYHEDDKYGEKFGYGYKAVDPAPWGAMEAWERVYDDGGRTNRFLLCYGRSIVLIDFGPEWTVRFGPDWAPTPDQMATVGEKLGK